MGSYGGLWDNLERFVPIHSIDRESATIQSKNFIRLQFFPESNQRPIGKVHRNISIPFNQSSDPV